MKFLNNRSNGDFWKNLVFGKADFEFIFNLLLEREVPLSTSDLVNELIPFKISEEIERIKKENSQMGEVYMPKNDYSPGDVVAFPSVDLIKGKVISKRKGFNPDIESFNVIEVLLEDGAQKIFACSLENHPLNQVFEAETSNPNYDPEFVMNTYGSSLLQKLEDFLSDNEDLVRIAGNWFPRALLVDVNAGHLNLAEAVLEEAHGGPLDAIKLLKQVELSADVHQKLLEFSFDLALQEDDRFDEVGPSGKVLWFLRDLEPDDVKKAPIYLKYDQKTKITDDIKQFFQMFEGNLYDELDSWDFSENDQIEAKISLIFPHWRSGTLPLSNTLSNMFPTAYEAPRVRFTFIDEDEGSSFPGWVVRSDKYVYGLKEWYEKKELIPGNFVSIRKGSKEGEIIVRIEKSRQNREWLKTILVGTDHGIVFAMLKHPVTASFNERMAIAIPDVATIDELWTSQVYSKEPIEKTIFRIMRELSKLNPQGQVHAQELYSAVNIIRRCPPSIVMTYLTESRNIFHLGDLYFRIQEGED